MPSPLTYTRIARPEDVIGVASPNAYLAKLVESLAERKALRPSKHIAWPQPHRATGATLSIRQGRWIAECPCGSLNSYDPEWQFAVCLSCAAIYEQAPPSEWRAIEACLMLRPQENRNYWKDDTLASLRRENVEHGLDEGSV